MIDEQYIVLYGPRDGKPMRRLYPEIAAEETLKSLPNEDIFFAWLMGIPFSPVDHKINISARLKISAARAINNEAKREQYAQEKYPEEVKKAIRWFEGRAPEARWKIKSMQQMLLTNYEAIVYQKLSDDLDDQKKYVEITTKINDAFPDILKKVEDGYGIVETKKAEEQAAGNKSIDSYQKNKQSRS